MQEIHILAIATMETICIFFIGQFLLLILEFKISCIFYFYKFISKIFAAFVLVLFFAALELSRTTCYRQMMSLDAYMNEEEVLKGSIDPSISRYI